MASLFVAIICMSIYFIKKPVISSNKKVGPQPDGSVLVPSNQLLRPAGLQVFLPGRPVDLRRAPPRRLAHGARAAAPGHYP